MTRSARIGFLVAAFVVLVLAIVFIGTGDDETSEKADNPPIATSTPGAQSEAEPQDTPQPTPTPEPVPRIRTEGGSPVGEPERIEVDKGDRIRFVVTSDVPEEIHVHGFDRYADLGPGQPARLDFKADIDGIYEVELHGTGEIVAELRINP